MGAVWNAGTGLNADLYPCPECKKPFMAIDDFSLRQDAGPGLERKLCPRCNKVSLKCENRAYMTKTCHRDRTPHR